MQKIDSAYTKTASRTKSMTENGRAFVKSSDVLYLDKKRTTRLLSAIGFYMPITCDRSGYIGSISYNGENVNIRGAKFSDVISESFDLEQEQRRDYQKYSYEWFAAKPDMAITLIDDTASYRSSQDRKRVVNNGIENARAVGTVNSNGNTVVHVADNGADVIVTKNSVKHSLDRRAEIVGPVVERVGDILKNAIQINELNPRSENIKDSYILMSAAKNKTNEHYVISFVVNRYSNELVDMDVMYSVNAKRNQPGDCPQALRRKAPVTLLVPLSV